MPKTQSTVLVRILVLIALSSVCLMHLPLFFGFKIVGAIGTMLYIAMIASLSYSTYVYTTKIVPQRTSVTLFVTKKS